MVNVAIVGSGPAGLSAAAQAAQAGLDHVLLEAEPHFANTIYLYQKGKYVMAEPAVLPLRSGFDFDAGTREDILAAWEHGLQDLAITIRYNARVEAITGQRGAFVIKLGDGQQVDAQHVVLAIGLQGNLRKLGVPGEDLPFVQYQLDDPDEYAEEVIVVVGAGDSAIENALALSEQNKVCIVNRRGEFDRAKGANLAAITRAISQRRIECFYNSAPVRVEADTAAAGSGRAGRLILKSAAGEVIVACDRIIARLGATPPRKFVESCGICFPSDDPNATPVIDGHYQSSVPGIYVVGALAGCPLIKQAMNQGYEVIEHIMGREVAPADEPVLSKKFKIFPNFSGVARTLELVRKRVPLFAELTDLQMREFFLESDIVLKRAGETIFALNDYSDALFSILNGTVDLQIGGPATTSKLSLGPGAFFGETSLISGRRRPVTALAADTCVLIETPRRSMSKLMNSVASVRRAVDEAFFARALQIYAGTELPETALADLVRVTTLVRFDANAELFKEGDVSDALYFIRSGSVTLSRRFGTQEQVVSYVAAGNFVGVEGLFVDRPRFETARAAIATEAIRLERLVFLNFLSSWPMVRRRLRKAAEDKLAEQAVSVRVQSGKGSEAVIPFLMAQGIGEATDVLLIDESLCVRCDQCEKACAETHKGVSRLDRETGPTYAFIHVPTSCRHCEHPHCMKDCPPDALQRAPDGEVIINDSCIGCGNCERNCPYGVIKMAARAEPEPVNVLSWLLFGKGRRPGDEVESHGDDKKKKVATKCDMCKGLTGGPACVRACPTGAAIRVSPEQFIRAMREEEA